MHIKDSNKSMLIFSIMFIVGYIAIVMGMFICVGNVIQQRKEDVLNEKVEYVKEIN